MIIPFTFNKFVGMHDSMDIKPFPNELPSMYADRIGQIYANTVTIHHKKVNGQYLTPLPIANFMARLPNSIQKNIKILDPGCGTAILSSSLIEHLAKSNNAPENIELTVYETDKEILPYTKAVLNYLSEWIGKFNVNFKFLISTNDFILENKRCFDTSPTLFFELQSEVYDIVISNPPYFKISKEDKRAVVAKSIVWGQPNIYSIFMMCAARLLKENGTFIFIVPRSFSSGNYFRAFRESFFNEIDIEQVHLFGSRTDTFDRDNVLQETLILKGKKLSSVNHKNSIVITHSFGIKDIDSPTKKVFQTSDLIDFNSSEIIFHLPTNDVEEKVITMFRSWSGCLNHYGIQISTGPVVSFRATQYLHKKDSAFSKILLPFYQLVNTGRMQFEWPVTKKHKPQYIELCDGSISLLIPNKNYIFLRRFSAKDDKARLIAAPYFADLSQAEFIGVENHLNYIYRPNGHLDRNEILGLSALLNSKLFDIYFRTFNGNINVSATELREMPLPSLEDIRKVGNEIILINNFSQAGIDEIVNSYFNLEHIFSYE